MKSDTQGVASTCTCTLIVYSGLCLFLSLTKATWGRKGVFWLAVPGYCLLLKVQVEGT